MNPIVLRHVSKTYPGSAQPAVKELNLSVARGQILTLLGPSGCGKTTTLRLIAGFEAPDTGRVYLQSRLVAGPSKWVPPEKRQVGVVFQDYALFPHLTVQENLSFGLVSSGKSAYRNKKKVKQMLELTGLQGVERRYPHELSGGQQQRVALARALVRDPVLVLLDEPFSNLDAHLRAYMRREIGKILRQWETTAILVTHDQKDALSLADSVAIIREGKLEQAGTPREVYQFPKTEFVAIFVGQSNILEGTVDKDRNTVQTELGPVRCTHTHGKPPGSKVKLSIKPESFELDPRGEIAGVVEEFTYGGNEIEALLRAPTSKGNINILVHVHPENRIKAGERLRFRILPHFVAIIS